MSIAETRANGGNPQESPRPVRRILITDPLQEIALRQLIVKGYDVDCRFDLTPDLLSACIGEYDAVVVRSSSKLDRGVLDNSGRLKLIVRAGVGVDNIDVDAATRKGIYVLTVPEANTVSAAEHTIALALAVARRIPGAQRSLIEGKWERIIGRELSGKTWGLIGVGNVGSTVARTARDGLAMQVVGFDPFISADRASQLGVALKPSIEEVLRVSDVVSVHVPYNSETHHLIDETALSHVKPDAIFINTARGGIVDEGALVAALESEKLGGAGLDVFEGEPNVNTRILAYARTHHNLVLTPHLGASTIEAQNRVVEGAVARVIAFFEGGALEGGVNIPRIAPEIQRVLEPYRQVCEQAAYLAAALARGSGKRIREAYVRYAGDGVIASREFRPLQAAIVAELFRYASEERINLINYKQVAQQFGCLLHEIVGPAERPYDNLIQVRLVHDDGETTVSGTSFPHGPRITEINGFRGDIPLTSKAMLLVSNLDQPGMVGKVGTLLGQQHVNITEMRVARSESVPGQALMVLLIEEALRPELLAEIGQQDGIFSALLIQLGDRFNGSIDKS